LKFLNIKIIFILLKSCIEESKFILRISPTKIGGGDDPFTGEESKDEGVRVASDVGSLPVGTSNACNFALLRGGSPKTHASYNNHEAKAVSVNNVVNFDLIAQCK
jgi:hypothetical protein